MTVRLHGTGVWTSQIARGDRTRAIDAAVELEALGFPALWLPGGFKPRVTAEVLDRVAAILDRTDRLVVATGIVSVWAADPADVAAARAGISTDHPDRFLLGIGVSHGPLVDSVEAPGTYRRPLATVVRFLDALDAASPPVPRDGRCLAALGPAMLDLAGRRTLGTHPYLVTPDHTRFARDRLGPDALVAPEQTVVLERDPGPARTAGRQFLTTYLGLPNYTNNLRRFGFDNNDLADGGSDRLVDAVIAWGDVDAIAARVAEHYAAGADHVCIQVVTDDPNAFPHAEWKELAPALTARP
jgi:probable F420-dependent oxidoreductase